MDTHTNCEPASQIPVKNTIDGTVLTGRVEFQQGSQFSDAGEDAGEGIDFVVDLTGASCGVAITVAGRQYAKTLRHGWGSETLEHVIDALRCDGYELLCCFTCRYYMPSSMISDWSLGTMAYCVLKGEADTDEWTHMLHTCPNWAVRSPDQRDFL